jgi:type I restriction enzyme S subunit
MLRITDIQDGHVDWQTVPYCVCADVEKYKLHNDDIVFARTGATVGKSFLIKDVPRNAIFASYLIRLRAKEGTLPQFLYYFFQSPDYWDQIKGHAVGAAQPNVNGSKLAALKIPLPPLAEQKRIVKKLDALSDNVRKLRDLQTRQLADLKELKQAILREVFA